MLFAHYEHRLPADYDLGRLRQRAAIGGPMWDQMPDLCFKAFVLRTQGNLGAASNAYASVYLWDTAAGFARFVSTPRFNVVTGTFGRPAVDTALGLDLWRGDGAAANVLLLNEIQIDADDNVAGRVADMREASAELARTEGVVAVALALEPRTWRLKQVVLADGDGGLAGRRYEVLYLASTQLPPGPHRQPENN